MKLYLINTDCKVEIPKNCTYIYFSKNYFKFLRLKNKIQPKSEFYDFSTLLDKTAKEIKASYIDFIGKLSANNNLLSWWVSHISEKNVMTSPLFLYACYLTLFIKLIKTELYDKDICVFSDSDALLKTIKELRSEFGFDVVFYLKNRNIISNFIQCCKRIYRIIRFLLNKIYFKFLLLSIPSKKTLNLEKNYIFIRTWVSEKNFDNKGNLFDSYFPTLKQKMEELGENVAVIPIFYNVKNSKNLLKIIRNSENIYIIKEDWLKLADYFNSIFIASNNLWICKRNTVIFNGFDMKHLFLEEINRTAFDFGVLDFLLYYPFFARLKEKKIKLKSFIMTFENMFPEKPVILSIKKFYKETLLIGYQHSAIFSFLLSFFPSKNEINIMPLPDRIVCSGYYFLEKLASENYPKQILRLGPALRFQHLFAKSIEEIKSNSKNNILIALPLEESSALEILCKTNDAVEKGLKSNILIKPHPMMKKEIVNNLIMLSNLKRYEITDLSIEKALANVIALLSLGSSSLLDALGSGVPVISVRKDHDIPLDPLMDFDNLKCYFVVYSGKEIKEVIEKIESIDLVSLNEMVRHDANFIRGIFSKIDNEKYSAFYN